MTPAAVDLNSFVRDRASHLAGGIDTSKAIELGAPRMHYESQDTCATISGCLDWRAEIRMSALDAHGRAPDVVVGSVDFLVLQLGRVPVAEVLPYFGERAVAFAELFDDEYLADDLDEDESFTGGMLISTVLLVLGVRLDLAISDSELRPWAVAQTVDTMLPTTAGLVAMHAAAPTTPRKTTERRLVSVGDVDPDWPRVGCTMIPGHPRFFGQATAYTYLDDARAALEDCRNQVLRISIC